MFALKTKANISIVQIIMQQKLWHLLLTCPPLLGQCHWSKSAHGPYLNKKYLLKNYYDTFQE